VRAIGDRPDAPPDRPGEPHTRARYRQI